MPQRQNRVQEEFMSYRESVIPQNASAVQLQECRRAFYAGAHAVLQRILAGLSTPDEPTADDLRMMDEIEAELRDFASRVKQGRGV